MVFNTSSRMVSYEGPKSILDRNEGGNRPTILPHPHTEAACPQGAVEVCVPGRFHVHKIHVPIQVILVSRRFTNFQGNILIRFQT